MTPAAVSPNTPLAAASSAMFAPTSSSGTAWIAPPDARAVAIARSPSAGAPIASECATVAGRTGDDRPLLGERGRDRRAPLRLPAVDARQLGRRRGRRAELLEALPELREQRAGGDRRDDCVGKLPAELLGDLERERLRALRVVRAQVHVDERPVELARQLDDEPAAVVVAAADGDHLAAVDRGRDAASRARPCSG